MPKRLQGENCTYINSKSDDYNDDGDNNKVKPAACFMCIYSWNLYIGQMRYEPVCWELPCLVSEAVTPHG